jgi:hypothetical protein
VPDCDDECLRDTNKSLPVRVAAEKQVDRDTDSEGVLDCDDECLKDSNKSLPVRVAAEKQLDTDTDGDGVPDCIDECLLVTGPCGVGEVETDFDSDGFPRSHRRMAPRP